MGKLNMNRKTRFVIIPIFCIIHREGEQLALSDNWTSKLFLFAPISPGKMVMAGYIRRSYPGFIVPLSEFDLTYPDYPNLAL